MSRSAILFVAVVLGLAISSSHLYAQCVDQPREVTLDKENTVALKSYLCKTGTEAGAAQFRVEYYRLSDGAASLLLANSSSTKLRKTLGPVKIISNEVSRTYADLIKQFGVTADVPNNDFSSGDLSFKVTPAGARPGGAADNGGAQENKDKAGLKTLRTLFGFWGPIGDDYPAVSEIAMLRRKTISSNLHYYYSYLAAAKDSPRHSEGCDKKDLTCKLGGDIYQITIWRPFTVGDMEAFNANVKEYNAQLLKIRKNKKDAQYDLIQARDSASDYDRLVKFISGGQLPNDFLFLLGRYQTSPDCGDMSDGDLPGLAGWSFKTARRNVKIDAVFVENLSNHPLAVDRLFGERNSGANLRVAERILASPANPVALDGTSGEIAPGQTAIILTRIMFVLSDEQLADFRKFRESIDTLHAAFGADGLAGNISAYRSPDPKDYTYGPALNVTGASVNARRIDFASRPVPNFLELTASQEGASCPYLLSWDDHEQEWVSHGKILQHGQGQANAYAETVIFPGLRTRFRIEEREPELGHVQGAKLLIELRDGSTQTFSPLRHVAGGAGEEITLMWGEGVNIEFAVPTTLNAKDVRQTRLQVTGYYERYSSLLVGQRSPAATPFKVNSTQKPPAIWPRPQTKAFTARAD